MDYAFITDTHFSSYSNVRTGDYLGDLIFKLEDVLEKVNSWDATLLIGGDLFDKPSVPDYVKSAVVEVLTKFNHVPYAIYGNHDILFNSFERNQKTSLNLLFQSGVLKELKTVDFDDHVLTAEKPLVERGKPQLAMFHGFLNKDDGRNTFLFPDIETDDPCMVFLGHDHVVYQDAKYRNSTIHRIGSFVRGIRTDDHLRIPSVARIRLKEGRWIHKLYPIKCKDPQFLFKEKESKAVQESAGSDYAQIIEQIRKTTSKDVSLEEAFKLITDPDLFEYLKVQLLEVRNKKLNK